MVHNMATAVAAKEKHDVIIYSELNNGNIDMKT